jgi:hypothetical protein
MLVPIQTVVLPIIAAVLGTRRGITQYLAAEIE